MCDYVTHSDLQYRFNVTSHSHDTFPRFYWSTRVINICDSRENHWSSKQYSIEIISRVSTARQIAIGHGQLCYNGGHITILLCCQIIRYYMYLVTVIPLVHLFASQHCDSTFTNSTINTQAFYS